MALPPHRGGLGISNPLSECSHEYAASRTTSGPLAELIVSQADQIPMSVTNDQKEAKTSTSQRRRQRIAGMAEDLQGASNGP